MLTAEMCFIVLVVNHSVPNYLSCIFKYWFMLKYVANSSCRCKWEVWYVQYVFLYTEPMTFEPEQILLMP